MVKKFKKVYIELTNICNLKCSFCPPPINDNKTMSLENFNILNFQLKDLTKQLAYHLLGDPLVLSNLKQYLDISFKYNLKVNITTTGNTLKKDNFKVLFHKTIRQINFSINSYNANSHKKSLEEYLNPILDFLSFCIDKKQEFFINLRIWNFDEAKSCKEFNTKVFNIVNKHFNLKIDLEKIYKEKPKNIRIARKVFFDFDEYFKWPSLDNEFVSKEGFCYGLDSHFGITSSGTLVPCCLDINAKVNLGDFKKNSLKDILSSKKVTNIQEAFKKNIIIEELCQKCEYRTRFDT